MEETCGCWVEPLQAIKLKTTVCRPDLPYLAGYLPTFVDRADVLLQVSLTQLPAHTQVLASKSRFIAKLLEDVSPLDQHKPLVISSFLDGYSLEDVSNFLLHIYRDLPVKS